MQASRRREGAASGARWRAGTLGPGQATVRAVSIERIATSAERAQEATRRAWMVLFDRTVERKATAFSTGSTGAYRFLAAGPHEFEALGNSWWICSGRWPGGGADYLNCTVTSARGGAERKVPGRIHPRDRTGTRCTTLTKFPLALSGRRSEKRDPVPPERLSSFAVQLRPGERVESTSTRSTRRRSCRKKRTSAGAWLRGGPPKERTARATRSPEERHQVGGNMSAPSDAACDDAAAHQELLDAAEDLEQCSVRAARSGAGESWALACSLSRTMARNACANRSARGSPGRLLELRAETVLSVERGLRRAARGDLSPRDDQLSWRSGLGPRSGCRRCRPKPLPGRDVLHPGAAQTAFPEHFLSCLEDGALVSPLRRSLRGRILPALDEVRFMI